MSWSSDRAYPAQDDAVYGSTSSHTSSNYSMASAAASASSEPIPIRSGPTFSQSGIGFSQFPHSSEISTSSSSAGFGEQGDEIIDGPLNDLLPAFSVSVASASGSSSSGEICSFPQPESYASSLGRGLPSTTQAGHSPYARRVVSAPPRASFSPGSPLARQSTSAWGSTNLLKTRRKSAQFPLPGSPPTNRHFPPSSSPNFAHPSPKSSRRRSFGGASSFSLGGSSSPAPPFGSFVGSFEQSLLTGRLSALPSLPLPFISSIGVLGDSTASTNLRCPPHVTIPFEAFFHSESSPYVGTVNLESHYTQVLLEAPTDPLDTKSKNFPRFPGYRVPVRGQLQLVIKNPNTTAIKLFLIPFNLKGLDRNGKGGKTFVRQKSYLVEEGTAEGKGPLRYAVHLQFCSPPVETKKGRATPISTRAEPQFFLHGNIRLVFASRALDQTEKLRVVAEGPNGVYLTEGMASSESFAAYGGPGVEWQIERKKAKERERLRIERLNASRVVSQDSNIESDDVMMQEATSLEVIVPEIPLDPSGTDFDLAQSQSPTPRFGSPATTQLPAAFHFAQLSRNLPKSSLSLSFARPESPITRVASPNNFSALSASRPQSRTEIRSNLVEQGGR